jgi:mevalonate kinase
LQTSYLAHGKVILIGEHSVVYGYNALSMPIQSLNIKTTVSENNDNYHYMDTDRYHGDFFKAPAEYAGLKYILQYFLNLKPSSPYLKISYRGLIPIERGLGSSATVSLGTTKALNEFFKLKLSDKEIMAITNHAETINHGKASGLDSATVNSDYLVFFNKKTGVQILKQKLNATLLIMDTGDLGNTKEAVELVKNEVTSSKKQANNLENLGNLTDQVKQAWISQDAKQVGQAFTKAQKYLAELKVSTPKIDHLCQLAIDTGAYGAKLSGGGLGGIVIALCPNQELAQTIANKCHKLISNYWIEEI